MSESHKGKVHPPEVRAKIGRPRTPEEKAKISAASKRNIGRILLKQAAHKDPTDIEQDLYGLLTLAYGENGFETQKRFGSYLADAYTEEDNIVWEADGSYWHRDKAKDAKRDEELISQGVAAVVRFPDTELKKLRIGIIQ